MRIRVITVLAGLALTLVLAGCEQEPAEPRAEDHVFKGQVQAIDKAREVETMLRQKSDAQQ